MTSSTEQILATFGATTSTLDETQRTRLDRDGYLPLPGILSSEQVEALRRRFGQLLAAEGDQAGLEAHQEDGADRLANLVDKDPLFDLVWNNPVQLAAVAHVLD
ncbi:MAG TPA: phytanoyl-CoA dioxygenase family protein, partial [Acidimicrobiales bacterium]|nr:phytanoyl-CoA dioxygenase family protein [Acidimicrobiales bacterium]